MATLELRGIEKHYAGVHAVDGINLKVKDGEFLAILGPSGCGKSTTMRMIAGLETPTVGDILIDGAVVTQLPPRLRNVSMVFQSYALYPHMSVAENIAFPLKAAHMPREQREQKVAWASKLMGVEALMKRRPARLSGGEKQKVALARALVRDPTLFIFDEPLSSLDAQVRAMARGELRQLHDRTGITTVYVTHDQVEAMGMGDRVAVMKSGQVRQLGTPQELYSNPVDTFVASFLGTPPMNLLRRGSEMIGFRPECVRVLRPDVAVGDDDFRLEVKVIELEFLGADWQVYAYAESGDESHKLLARVDADGAAWLKVGERAEFTVQQNDLRYFDAASGKRIEHGGR